MEATQLTFRNECYPLLLMKLLSLYKTWFSAWLCAKTIWTVKPEKSCLGRWCCFCNDFVIKTTPKEVFMLSFHLLCILKIVINIFVLRMSKGRIEENLWRNIYSCLNIQLTDSVLEAMDKTEQITALVLLDLSKAFDSIDHARLLSHKLPIVGASPSTVNWFKSYLSSRYQYVRIWSTHSDALPITHGVPQGAILSTLLFCIYLNDLPLAPSSCNLKSYVDDSKLFLSIPLIELDAAIEKLEQDLVRVAQ